MSIYQDLINSGKWPVCGENEGRAVNPNPIPPFASGFITTQPPLVQYLFYDVLRYYPEGDQLKLNYEACWDLMDQLAEPFYAQFVDTTDNVEFLRIANKFFHAAFWKGYVYVGRGTYEEMADSLAMDEDAARVLENLGDGEEHYHLYYDGGINIASTSETPIFTHLETGLIFEIEDWKERFVKFEWGRPSGCNIFKRWFTFATKVVLQERDFADLAMLCKKRAIHHQADELINESKATELEQMLLRPSPLVRLGEGDYIQEKVFMTPVELCDYQRAGLMLRDRWISELGIVANTNPKMERLTTGENYKDIVSVADRQRATLNNLKYFALKVKDRWGDELSFALNGIPQRANMEGDIETATMANENPNLNSVY